MSPALPDNIKTVRIRSPLYYFYAKTARINIMNVSGHGELRTRKSQDFIQTWHASNGYKHGSIKDQESGFGKKQRLLYAKDYTYVLSGCESMTRRRVRGTFEFSGPVIPGTPRMDLIINYEYPEFRQKVYEFFGIDAEKKILLYAPTWREDRNLNDYGLKYSVLKAALEERFGGDWIIAVRLHQNIKTDPEIEFPYVKDATKYPDMEELLCVVDCLISDYSSCIWDYSFTGRPCFLFCSDIDKYERDRGLEISVKNCHFPFSENMVELCELIRSYNEDEFRKNMELHHKEMGNLEDGKATERVCALIHDLCFRESDD